jgi:threonine/homoserine/homoserine lactone efflux protein
VRVVFFGALYIKWLAHTLWRIDARRTKADKQDGNSIRQHEQRNRHYGIVPWRG